MLSIVGYIFLIIIIIIAIIAMTSMYISYTRELKQSFSKSNYFIFFILTFEYLIMVGFSTAGVIVCIEQICSILGGN